MARFDVSYYTKDPRFNSLLCREIYTTNQEAIDRVFQKVKERNEKAKKEHHIEGYQIVGFTIYRYQPKTYHWKTIYEKRQL